MPEDYTRAAMCNNFPTLQFLFHHDHSDLHPHTFTHTHLQSLLRLSCLGGCVEMTSFWIKLGGNVNTSYYGNLLVKSICRRDKDNVEMMKLLLDNGADTDGDKVSLPLVACIHRGHLKMAKLLLERGSSVNGEALATVARIGRVGEKEALEIAREIIERGAEVVNNHLAFYYAVCSSNDILVKMLLENGASV